MLYYITLVLVFWALIYTAARFLQYYRIVKTIKKRRRLLSNRSGITNLQTEKSRRPLTCFFPMRSPERREALRSLFRGCMQGSIRLEARWGSAIMRKKTALCILQLQETRRERLCTVISPRSSWKS